MIIEAELTHLGGREIMVVRHEALWHEIRSVISAARGSVRRSGEKSNARGGTLVWAPKPINKSIGQEFLARGWRSHLGERGTEMDYLKGGVGVEVQFGKYSFFQSDFVKFMERFEDRIIEVGVEIVPSRRMLRRMSSGPGDVEYVRQILEGSPRLFPTVPVVVLGIAPEGVPEDYALPVEKEEQASLDMG